MEAGNREGSRAQRVHIDCDRGSADDPRREFDDEFKAGAVRLVLDEGQSVGRVARELDLTESAFRNWVRQARADRTKGRTGLTGVEREELRRLRKENRRLRVERDVLKKAAAPKFNVVSKPNDWSQSVASNGRLSETQVAQRAYWEALHSMPLDAILSASAQTGEEALADLRVRAAQGDADAQFNLGVTYNNGEGVPQDAAGFWRQDPTQRGESC